MAKVGDSYDSVVRGVSEQVAHERRPGQHEEQVNMISDPVHGLARRRGSVYQDQIVLPFEFVDAGPEAKKMRVYDFKIDGVDYCVLYRTTPSVRPGDTFMYCYNKKFASFVPVEFEASTWVNDLIAGGVSAITNVGRYLYIAGNENIPTFSVEDRWGTETNLSRMVAWVRGGAYSRTFKLTLTKDDGTTVEVSYKTKPSAYPELNDTSDIEFYLPSPPAAPDTPDPEYQKKINDRNNEYNSLVTQWIGIAAEDITGENIAQKLVDELVLLGVAASRQDSTVIIEDTDFVDISADDGGDSTLIRAVGKEVSAPTLMSTVHYVGKVVRIRPLGASDKEAYYLEAYAKDEVSTGWTDVIWRESAGVVQTPLRMFSQAVIHAGTMYVAQNGAGLDALAVGSGPHPDYVANIVGDGVSSPIPQFFGKPITMLTVFQDRLLVGQDGVVNASRPGDYLNFFRFTVLNVQDNDPIEMYSYGSEGDTLRFAVMFDKDLVLFGDKNQYGITGRAVLSAKSPNITFLSSHENAVATKPVQSGNFVFYGKSSEGRTSLNQLQIGQLTESPVSYEVSSQLDNYLDGVPAQILTLTTPNMVMMRTETSNDWYLYQYIDSPDGGQRLFDAFHKWRYNPLLGDIIGLSSYNGEVLIFTFRADPGNGGDTTLVIADKLNLSTLVSDLPYADSLIRYEDRFGSWVIPQAQSSLIVAGDRTTNRWMLGTSLDKVGELIEHLPEIEDTLWIGATEDAFVIPTNPYIRDRNQKSILSGMLTLGQVMPSVVDTGGLNVIVEKKTKSTYEVTFTGRLLGDSALLIGQQPIVTAQLVAGVGHEVRACRYTLRSERWLPLTITSIEWSGLWFNRTRRG